MTFFSFLSIALLRLEKNIEFKLHHLDDIVEVEKYTFPLNK